MFGLEIDGFGAGIDADFKSMSFIRKGELTHGQQAITCNLDEIVVVRATNSCVVNCYLVSRSGNQLRYNLLIMPASGFSINRVCPVPLPSNNPGGHGLKLEYYIFGNPRPASGQYGINVYNTNNEIVFSSANRYMSPVAMSSANPDGTCAGVSEYTSEKYGVVLQMSNAFLAPALQRNNGMYTAQTAIAFEEWIGGRRNIGIYITPMLIEGGGGTYGLNGKIDALIIDLKGL